MADTPIVLRRRPFAVFPLTQVMLPDGIFDTSLGMQRLTCHVTNDSITDLDGVMVYLESIGDPGAVAVPRTHQIGKFRAGASTLVDWYVDMTAASPGKKLVSILVMAHGHVVTRRLQRIFVTRTTYDDTTATWRCEVPEGTFLLTGLRVIGPARDGWQDDPDKPCAPLPGPFVPTHVNMRFVPNPAYPGMHGDLPFGDPWWKVVGWVVFVIAGLVAIIAAAAGGGGAQIGVGGTFDETVPSVKCCTPRSIKASGNTVAGIASIIATVGLAVGLADDADPFWRGQEATVPPAGVLTVAETVEADFTYAAPPNAGVPFAAQVSWEYRRELSNGQVLRHQVSEEQTNTHLVEDFRVSAPDRVTPRDELLCIEGAATRPGGEPYRADDLYMVAIFVSPAGLSFVQAMNDDGKRGDRDPADGVYTTCLDLNQAFKAHAKGGLDPDGYWKIYVFAQDINAATPDQLPQDAARSIGGYVVAGPVELTFDPSLPCPLRAQAVTYVQGP